MVKILVRCVVEVLLQYELCVRCLHEVFLWSNYQSGVWLRFFFSMNCL